MGRVSKDSRRVAVIWICVSLIFISVSINMVLQHHGFGKILLGIWSLILAMWSYRAAKARVW